MIRAAIICPDSDVRRQLLERLSDAGGVYILRRFDHYPHEQELARFLRAGAPEVIFISLDTPARAKETSAVIESLDPSIQIVAMHRSREVESLLQAMQAGVRQFLSVPVEPASLSAVILNIKQRRAAPVERMSILSSFLPAKPGAGASTLAINASAALARQPGSSVLLLDFDLNLGSIAFQLRLDGRLSVLHAARNAARMDESVWPDYYQSVDDLHVVPSGSLDPGAWLEPIQAQQLLNHAERGYQHIVVDHSGNVEKYSLEILRQSRNIFLVCGGDPGSVHLARQKVEFLREQEMGKMVTIVLNRVHRDDVTTVAEVERNLGAAVDVIVPYDRQTIVEAVEARVPVRPKSPYGKSCAEIARRMAKPNGTQMPAKRRFLEFFSLRSARASA